jgi:hypothetical protein
MRGMAEDWEAGGPIRTVSCRALAADPDAPRVTLVAGFALTSPRKWRCAVGALRVA